MHFVHSYATDLNHKALAMFCKLVVQDSINTLYSNAKDMLIFKVQVQLRS